MRIEQRLLDEIDRFQPAAIEMLQNLVRIPSITGDEKKAQTFVQNSFADLGLTVDAWCPTHKELSSHSAFSDDGLPLGERAVVVGRLKGSDSSARSLILNGHVDVVPPGEESAWENGPWSASIRDGKLFGRGSCDMKGGLVSGIAALAAIKKSGMNLRGDVLIQSVIGEETGGVGTLATIQRGYRADAAIVLEPTRMALCPVGAGAASFRLHVSGRSAHGAMRMEGVSAIEKFYLLLDAIHELEHARHSKFRHPLFSNGELISPISVGKVMAGDWPSTVPEKLIAEGRFGVLPGEDIAGARSDFESAIRKAGEKDAWLKEHPPQVEWFEGQFESAETPAESPILRELAQSHQQMLGAKPPMHGVPYGSDLRFFTNNAKMPAVLYGPGDVRVAHSANEFVPLNEVMAVSKIVGLTILRWCGLE